jgi:hypothetical protein
MKMKILILFALLALSVLCHPGTTPTCAVSGVTSDVAFVTYQDGPTTNCFSANHRIRGDSVWFGYKYGVCSQMIPCGFNCTLLEECGSKGLTMNEFNQCYSNVAGCNIAQQYVIMSPLDDYHINGVTYTDAACTQYTGSNNLTSTTVYDLDVCFSGFNQCGYTSFAWVRLNACPPPEPDTNSASTFDAFMFF